MNEKIILVDDDNHILTSVSVALRNEGWQVETYPDGEKGLIALQRNIPDLVILDIKMPRIDGMEMLKRLRISSNVPVIFLTSKDEEIDEALGLRMGADDYITKPFSSVILLARVKAVLRRGLVSNTDLQRIVINQGIKVDPNARNAFIDDSKIVLTFTEFQILYLLVSHPGWVFTRYQIIDRIRGEKHPVTDRSVDFQIVGLRKKMGHKGKLIETIRGVGYRFHLNET